MIMGYIGMVLLLASWASTLTKYKKLLIPLNMFGSFFLTMHAVMLRDVPFIVVNVVITAILLMKMMEKKK